MDFFVILVGLFVTTTLLFVGIITKSQIAHGFSFVTGAFLALQAMLYGMPMMTIWAFALLSAYPLIQIRVLREINHGKK